MHLTQQLVESRLSDASFHQSKLCQFKTLDGIRLVFKPIMFLYWSHNLANGVGNVGELSNQRSQCGLLKIVSGSAIEYQEVVNRADSYSVRR